MGVLWLDVSLAVACLLVAAHYVGRLVTDRVPFVPAASHVVMGVGMAAMFVPAFDPVPRPAWVAIFLLIGAWFGAAAVRAGSLLGDPGHLAVGAVAMLFMLFAHTRGPTGPAGPVDPEPAHHGGATAGSPGLLLTVVAFGFAAWFIADVAHRLGRAGATGSPATVSVAVYHAAGAAGPVPGAADAPPAVPRSPMVLAGVAAPMVMSAAMAIMLLGMG